VDSEETLGSAQRVAAADAAVAQVRATPALVAWLNQLVARQKRKSSGLTVEWVLAQYKEQEGACFYTGVQMAFDGHGEQRKFRVSLERLDRKSGYLKSNTVLICWEANTVNMSVAHADLLYGPKR
jgi:hypothetical protein